MALTARSSSTVQKLPFGDWDAKYDYIRQYRHTCYLKHTPLDAVTVECCSYIYWSSTTVLSPNYLFLDCATVAFSEGYTWSYCGFIAVNCAGINSVSSWWVHCTSKSDVHRTDRAALQFGSDGGRGLDHARLPNVHTYLSVHRFQKTIVEAR